MDEEKKGNGHSDIVTAATAQLTIDFDPLTFEIKIGGAIPNFDCALAMLAQATRYFETQSKLAQLGQVQRVPSGLIRDILARSRGRA
jgi:hypothetical protein